MDNPAEAQLNTKENNNSEFAQKEPLVYKQTIKKYAVIGVSLILLIAILITGIVIYQRIKDRLDNPAPVPTPTPTPTPEVPKAESPLIAYVKNDKSIWLIDTNGENKRMLLELPASSNQSFSSLAWKTNKLLSYSLCTQSVCTVETYDIDKKSTSTEILNAPRGTIDHLSWARENKFLSYVVPTSTGQSGLSTIELYLKTGTVNTMLTKADANTKNIDQTSRTQFSPDEKYIAYSFEALTVPEGARRNTPPVNTPTILVYQTSGIVVDKIINAKNPMFLDNDTLSYEKDGALVNKKVGVAGSSTITPLVGFNVTNSPDNSKYAYWNPTGGFSDALLIIYDTNLKVHRNILRGVILPEWINNSSIVGIKADNCLGEVCELYEYQTVTLATVNIESRTQQTFDQGRNIRDITVNYHAN